MKGGAVIGLRQVALAPVLENGEGGYRTGPAVELGLAGTLNRVYKVREQGFYSDDGQAIRRRKSAGVDVEIRLAEVPWEALGRLGLGDFDPVGRVYSGEFEPGGKVFALRCITETVEGLPYYFNYRAFVVQELRLDHFVSREDGRRICEFIIQGTLERPALETATAFSVMGLAEDGSNEAACLGFWSGAEVL